MFRDSILVQSDRHSRHRISGPCIAAEICCERGSESMKNPICIYHGNCADGFGAAWVVRRAIPECEFHAGVYQNEPPDVRGRDVILVDFSYKRPVLEGMARVAASLLIIDHHKTAIDELKDLM